MDHTTDTPTECPGCGSSSSDRRFCGLGTDLLVCPHCKNWKCHMCDMGDDCECPSCESED